MRTGGIRTGDIRTGGKLALVLVLLCIPAIGSGYQTYLATMVCNNVIVAIGLNVLSGMCGLPSFGQAGFYAIGAYVSGILMVRFEMPFAAAFCIATVVSGGLGTLIALPALRLHGFALAITTFGFAVLVQSIIIFFGDWTGGVNGYSIPQVQISSNPTFDLYYLNAGAALLILWISGNIAASKVGRSFLAIRGSEVAARSSGVNVGFYKALAFFISASAAGAAGCLYGQITQYISPETFDATLSVYFFAMIVVGGLGSNLGAVVGAVFFVMLPEVLSGAKELQMIIFGVSIVLVSMFMPKGFVGLLKTMLPSARLALSRLRGSIQAADV